MLTRRRIFLLPAALALCVLGLVRHYAGTNEPDSIADHSPPALDRPSSADGGSSTQPLAATSVREGEREALGLSEDEPAGPSGTLALRLRGIVTTPDETPLAGARVTVVDTQEHETLSDENGRFEFVGLERPGGLIVEFEDWMQIAAPEPKRAEDGGFTFLHVVMTPLASLELVALDAQELPVAGWNTRVDISPAEPHGLQESGYREYQPPRQSRTTDAHGVALYEKLAANCRLLVLVDRAYEWVADDELTERRTGAVPIVLEAGERRRLVVRLGTHVSLEGVVREASGDPSPRARVVVYALDQLDRGRRLQVDSQRADEEGRFRIATVTSAPTSRVLIVAQSTIGEVPPKGMFGGTKHPDPLCIDSLEIPLDAAGHHAPPLELTVSPLLAIAGTLRDTSGAGVHGSVCLVPHAESPLVDRLISGTPLTRESTFDGRFRFTGVPPGRYDVVATDRGRETVRIDEVEAGTEDLILTFPDGVPARVEVIVDCDDTLEQVVILCSRLEPLPGVGDDAPHLPRAADLHDPFGWPEPALGLWYGSQSYYGPLGAANFSSGPLQASDTKTLELNEGLYWIGAKARTVNGALCFPIGTGLVRVTRGEYRLRFHLTPSTTVRGIVRGAKVEDALCIALTTSDGRLIAMDVRREDMHDLTDLSAAGRFTLHQVPTGHYELRVGTAEELRTGRARLRHAIELVEGEEHEVELEL